MKKNHHFKKTISNLVMTLSLTATASYAAIYNPTSSNLSVAYGPCHSGNEKELKNFINILMYLGCTSLTKPPWTLLKNTACKCCLGRPIALQNHLQPQTKTMQRISVIIYKKYQAISQVAQLK
ncbi:hypothetical protein A0O36_01444 [Piscirickettsiaceae bacterium NZ-RLO1]|nr:hypothetical protein A0O36_01444 [Piscirickettsiaceae bacterium NZ-RLO1]